MTKNQTETKAQQNKVQAKKKTKARMERKPIHKLKPLNSKEHLPNYMLTIEQNFV